VLFIFIYNCYVLQATFLSTVGEIPEGEHNAAACSCAANQTTPNQLSLSEPTSRLFVSSLSSSHLGKQHETVGSRLAQKKVSLAASSAAHGRIDFVALLRTNLIESYPSVRGISSSRISRICREAFLASIYQPRLLGTFFRHVVALGRVPFLMHLIGSDLEHRFSHG
jgi:hypothetical protein